MIRDHRRVELNAMASDQFLAWLEAKLEMYGAGKVVPDIEVLERAMPWQRGESGNPGGRPKIEGRIRELAQQHGEKALLTLVALLDDSDPKVRVSAAEKILDRGFGRPAQAHQISGADAPVQVQHQHGLSEEAAAIVAETLRGLGRAGTD